MSTNTTIDEMHGHKAPVEFEYRMVPLPELRVDREAYQRDPDEERVKAIVERFDSVLFGVLMVNVRDDGSKWVYDGQNRLTAVRRLKHTHAPCILTHGMTIEIEADKFVKLDTERRGLSVVDKLRADLVGQKPLALATMRVADAADYKIELNPKRWRNQKEGYIKSIASLQKSIVRYGEPVTIAALKMLHQAWPYGNKSLVGTQANFIMGAARVLFMFNEIRTNDLATKLARLDPADIAIAANRSSEGQGWRRDTVFAHQLYLAYMKNRRDETRATFPAWESRVIRPSGRGDGSMQLTIFVE